MKIQIITLIVLFSIVICTGIEQKSKQENHAQWSVVKNGSELKIAYGSETAFPQYATLQLKDSYFRLVNSPSSGWGTSVILLPVFWTNGTYYQGAPVDATWSISGPDLVLSIMGTIDNLNVSSEVRITPPENNSISAHVRNEIEGSTPLDLRQAEAFKPIMLSSMHTSSSVWDTQGAFVDSQNYSIPVSGWIITPSASVRANTFGLLGGTSNWKQKAPTITIALDKPMQIAGWVTQSSNPNDDNVGYWAASDNITHSYKYTIIAVSS
ncbi:MAG: hypothetical protein ACE14P_03565 [Methanotrichaceae archaeon]